MFCIFIIEFLYVINFGNCIEKMERILIFLFVWGLMFCFIGIKIERLWLFSKVF